MCGIAGIVAENAKGYAVQIGRMVRALEHRGPDGSGTYLFEKCCLGHARLSIVDLDSGKQPMLSPVAPACITFNGEIYGYREIRQSLDGFPFKTHSDTEAILALYHKYDMEFLSRLPGMFAFGLWDDAKDKLICGRDRFGEKPLYYAFGSNGEFLFASEIKSLLASGLIRPVIDNSSVVHYLQYLYVHPSRTIYRNIFVLPPAHMLSLRKGRVSVERYWSFPTTRKDIGIDDAVEEFGRLLDLSVSRQLVADVPVGAFLSGGLDSSTIVAVASRHHSKLKTFSFGFEGSESELPYARRVAEMYGTDHYELMDDNHDIADLLYVMQDVYDEPFGDSSNIPSYLVSRLAKKHIKSVLTGDGGDELLAGYPFWYRPLLHMEETLDRARAVSYLLLLADKFSHVLGLYPGTARRQHAEGLYYRLKFDSIARAHSEQKKYFTDAEIADFGLHSYQQRRNLFGVYANTVDDAMRMDLDDYMPGDILVKADRASMVHGLELRAPFLDKDLASFCISLPQSLKISREEDKVVLRRAFEECWPPSVRQRGKRGFGAPVDRWLNLKSVRTLKDLVLNDPGQKIYSLLKYRRVRDVFNYYDRNKNKRNCYRIWTLLVLALWMERHDFLFEITE